MPHTHPPTRVERGAPTRTLAAFALVAVGIALAVPGARRAGERVGRVSPATVEVH